MKKIITSVLSVLAAVSLQAGNRAFDTELESRDNSIKVVDSITSRSLGSDVLKASGGGIIDKDVMTCFNNAVLFTKSAASADMKDLEYGEIIIPADIHVAAGFECNLWWSSIANVDEGDTSVYFETLLTDMSGSNQIGMDVRLMNMDRGIRFTPAESEVGSTYLLRIVSRRTADRMIISDVKTRVHVCAANAGDGRKNILMMGDSRTWQSFGGSDGVSSHKERCAFKDGNKTITTELKRLLDANAGISFTFCGHKISTVDPEVRNCADNGQTFPYPSRVFAEAGGMKAYLAANGMRDGSLDYATIMFGINDLSDWAKNQLDQYSLSKAKIKDIVAAAKALVDEISATYPEARIVLVLEPTTCAMQDGWAMWAGGITSRTSMEEMEKVSKLLRKVLIDIFDEGRYSSNVTISAAGLWCDRKYGFPFYVEKVSARQNVAEREVFIECVHPSDVGYGQIADGIFSTVKYLETTYANHAHMCRRPSYGSESWHLCSCHRSFATTVSGKDN